MIATNGNEPSSESAKLLTKAELAKRIGMTIRGLELAVNGGRIPKPFYLGPASPRWRPEDIDAHFARMAAEAQQDGCTPV